MLIRLKPRRSKMVKDVDLKDLTNTKLRNLLKSIKSDDQYILKENGKPRAVLLSLDDLEVLKRAKANKEKAWENLFANLKQVHALNPNVSEEQVHKDVAEAIRAVRQR